MRVRASRQELDLKKRVSQRITVENCAHHNRITSASQRITVKKQHIRHTHVPGWSYPAYTAGAGVGPSCARSGHCRSWRGGRLARGSAQAVPGAAIAGAGAGVGWRGLNRYTGRFARGLPLGLPLVCLWIAYIPVGSPGLLNFLGGAVTPKHFCPTSFHQPRGSVFEQYLCLLP